MVTINDVAREADVSPATVSRVINNSLVVSASKRQRVFDAIEKLGYEIPARSAGSGKLVLVITDSADPDINTHLYQSLSALDYQMFVFYFCESPDTQTDLMNFLKAMPLQQIAGMILCNFVRKIDEPLTRLLNEFPIVQIGSLIPFSRTALVRKNDFQAAYDLTTHLIQKGCKRIATFSHDSANLSNLLHASERESIYGYMAALFDAGLTPDPSLIIESDSTIDGCYEAVCSYLDAHPDDHADAFLCLLDTMALGTERALLERDIRIPDDVRIASLLGNWISRFAYPSLSSLNSPNEDLAKEAVRQLHMLITDPQPANRTISIPFQVTYRESSEGFEF